MTSARLSIDRSQPIGPFRRIWNSIGYDELNWTATTRGREIHRTLGREVFTGGPYWVRMHNTFTSGNELSTPAYGSGNCYFEAADGNPVFRWENLDRVFDAIIEPGGFPLVELGFMPKALSSVEFDTAQITNYTPAMTPYELGAWRYPPRDYDKWGALVHAFVTHAIERYGAEHVTNWRFELWNEPDIRHYWRGTLEEYNRLFEVTWHAAKRAFPGAQVGGPSTTDKGNDWLRGFLTHLRSVNIVPDFLSFHTKGAYFSPYRLFDLEAGHDLDSPSTQKMTEDITASLATIAEFPEAAGKPVYIDECDPAVGTIWGVFDNPNFVCTNSEHYPSFVAQLAGKLLADPRVTFFTHWAFYFEGKRWFEGNRTLVDNENVEKPIMNGLRLLERLAPGTQLPVESTSEQIGAIASERDGVTRILVWNHIDPWWETGSATVSLNAEAPSGASATITRLDRDHANTFRVWESLGSPQTPTTDEIERVRAARELSTDPISIDEGLITFDLPLHGLALIEITNS